MIHFMGMANKSFWGVGDNNKYPNGVASFLRTTANGGEVNWEKGAGGWENGYISLSTEAPFLGLRSRLRSVRYPRKLGERAQRQ